jgi:hypothetical protein
VTTETPVVSLADVLPDQPEIPAPPRRDPAPPVGSEDPGYTPKPRRGRPPKSARTTKDTTSAPKDGKKEELKPKDFTSDLAAIGDGLWLGLSSIPVTAPYAALVHMHQDGLVQAINSGAQVNPGVRNAVEKLTSGTGSAWALQLGIIGVNVAMQGYQLMKDPELRRQVTEANAAQMQAYMQQMGAVQVAEDA